MTALLQDLDFCLQLSQLLRSPGVDASGLRRQLQQKGRALDLARWQHPLLPGMDDQPDVRAEAAERAEAAGIRACCLCDADYPERLRQTDSCPLVLYYRGREAAAKWNHPFAVTVIGTRSPTQYGRLVTQKIVGELAQQQVLVISGLARGIDALAHQTVLEHGGLTLAVVAQGVDQVYPPEHRILMEQIVEHGLVVSEHPPGTRPLRGYFPARNRILSGLSDLVAVMEASRRSGTLITAGFAADQGRDVLAVPGSILLGRSEGCHQLIREGAGVIEAAQDLLELRVDKQLPLLASDRAATAVDQNGPAADERTRLRLLASAALTLEELAAALDWPVRQTAAWLGRQEIDGLIRRERGRYVLTERGFFCI